MSRKGYFFSISVLVLIGLAALMISSSRDPGRERAADLSSQRLHELQSFMDGIEADAEAAVRVAGHRALLATQEEIRRTGPLADPEDTLGRLITDGHLRGEEQPLLADESLQDWAAHLTPLAQQMRVKLDITIESVTITQKDPWHVTATATINASIEDDYTSSSWNRTYDATAAIPIEGLEDPLYTIGSEGRYTHLIKKAQAPVTDVRTHLEEHGYLPSQQGPSYLQRLAGQTSPSPLGIESLADADALAAAQAAREGSIIDYQYFGGDRPPTCPLPGLPAWAVIDRDAADRYGAECP